MTCGRFRHITPASERSPMVKATTQSMTATTMMQMRPSHPGVCSCGCWGGVRCQDASKWLKHRSRTVQCMCTHVQCVPSSAQQRQLTGSSAAAAAPKSTAGLSLLGTSNPAHSARSCEQYCASATRRHSLLHHALQQLLPLALPYALTPCSCSPLAPFTLHVPVLHLCCMPIPLCQSLPLCLACYCSNQGCRGHFLP